MAAARMRASSVFLALVMSLSLVTFEARPAHACSCMELPLKNEIRNCDAVFSGEVQSIDEGATTQGDGMAAPGRLTFAVQDSWKGVATDSVDVYGQGDGANCYNMLEEGEAYLVYASRPEGTQDAPLKNNGCGETKPLAGAGADLRLLGPPAGELPETGGPPPTALFEALIPASALLVTGMTLAQWRTRGQRH